MCVKWTFILLLLLCFREQSAEIDELKVVQANLKAEEGLVLIVYTAFILDVKLLHRRCGNCQKCTYIILNATCSPYIVLFRLLCMVTIICNFPKLGCICSAQFLWPRYARYTHGTLVTCESISHCAISDDLMLLFTRSAKQTRN